MSNAVIRTIALASLLTSPSPRRPPSRSPAAPAARSATTKNRCPARARILLQVRSAEPAAPSRRSKPATDERSSPRRSGGGGGGGGGGFDGAWAVASVGCGGSTSGAIVVTSGKIIGEGVRRGTVSPNGSVSTFGQGEGVTYTGAGRLSGRSGSGTWRRSDGCSGTWTGEAIALEKA